MTAPRVSIIVPAYESDRTLGTCLQCLQAQTFDDFELIVVDSSPDDRARALVRRIAPAAIYIHSPARLWPQAARNAGVLRARGEVLVFTDPDIYPPRRWLEMLVTAGAEHAVVLGSIACHGRRWLDRGAHLCKFSICLPGGEARAVRLGWSGNIRVERGLFDTLGGWEAAFVQGDSAFTERVRRAGHPLWFEPRCRVEHDHEGLTLRSFVKERFARGREFAAMEVQGVLQDGRWAGAITPARALVMIALTPLRIANAMRRVFAAARAAGSTRDYLETAPLVLLGLAAWYGGMLARYAARVIGRRRGRDELAA
jgi:glycosyltransferase involved in cell wall biosynthesis